MTRTVTAMFDRYEDAAKAVSRLEQLGISGSDVSLVSNDATQRERLSGTTGEHTEAGTGTGATVGGVLGGGAGLLTGLGLMAIPGVGPVVALGWLASTLVGAGAGAVTGGLVGALTGAGISEEDAHGYAEGIRRGGTLVTVRTDESHYDRVVDILDGEGTVDMNEREASWKTGGWSGRYDAGASAATANSSARAAGAPASVANQAGTDEVIPLAEERLNVGKREVEQGRVRVRSYTVETPVQKEVTLSQEHVQVERRPVDREVTGDPFVERTIEVTERAEIPVVSKETRVVEEVSLHKDAAVENRTVRDTVKKTEVEIEDEREKRNIDPKGTVNR